MLFVLLHFTMKQNKKLLNNAYHADKLFYFMTLFV